MTEQSNHTREQILTAAMQLFAEKGYHETSMAAIAERAGLGKGTLYWHFPSKDELFKQMITEKGQQLLDGIHTVVSQNLAPAEALRELIRVKLEFAEKERDFSMILMTGMQFTDQDFKLKLFQMHRKIISEIQQVVTQGMEAGMFIKGPADRITIAIIGMLNSLSMTLCYTDTGGTVEEMIDLLYQMILHGIIANQK